MVSVRGTPQLPCGIRSPRGPPSRLREFLVATVFPRSPLTSVLPGVVPAVLASVQIADIARTMLRCRASRILAKRRRPDVRRAQEVTPLSRQWDVDATRKPERRVEKERERRGGREVDCIIVHLRGHVR